MGEGSSPEILSHLPREIPYDQPMPTSYSGRRCLCIFMPAWLCHQTLVLASGIQGEQAAETQDTCPHSIPLMWRGLGPSECSTL